MWLCPFELPVLAPVAKFSSHLYCQASSSMFLKYDGGALFILLLSLTITKQPTETSRTCVWTVNSDTSRQKAGRHAFDWITNESKNYYCQYCTPSYFSDVLIGQYIPWSNGFFSYPSAREWVTWEQMEHRIVLAICSQTARSPLLLEPLWSSSSAARGASRDSEKNSKYSRLLSNISRVRYCKIKQLKYGTIIILVLNS